MPPPPHPPELPDDVRDFLTRRVEGFEELLVLLRLRTSAEPVGPADVAAALHAPESVADAALRRLVELGVAEAQGEGRERSYRYAPASPEIRATVERVAEAYGADPLEVVRLLTAQAVERVRSAAAKTLADAFLWSRRDRSDG